ncbi:hypothetical protein D3C74_210500 [compost metagenome]
MPLQPLHARLIKHIGIVVQMQLNVVSGEHCQREVIVRLLCHFNVFNRKPAAVLMSSLLHLLIDRIILKGHDMADQILLLCALRLNLIQRIIIVTTRIERLFLQSSHHFGKARIRFGSDAQRDRVNK